MTMTIVRTMEEVVRLLYSRCLYRLHLKRWLERDCHWDVCMWVAEAVSAESGSAFLRVVCWRVQPLHDTVILHSNNEQITIYLFFKGISSTFKLFSASQHMLSNFQFDFYDVASPGPKTAQKKDAGNPPVSKCKVTVKLYNPMVKYMRLPSCLFVCVCDVLYNVMQCSILAACTWSTCLEYKNAANGSFCSTGNPHSFPPLVICWHLSFLFCTLCIMRTRTDSWARARAHTRTHTHTYVHNN